MKSWPCLPSRSSWSNSDLASGSTGWTTLPVTPTSSLDAFHDMSTLLLLAAVAATFAGALGGDVSLVADVVTTSCGLFVASRELRSTPSVDVPASTRSYVPLPVTIDVTSNAAHVDVAIEATFPTPEPATAGLFAQVIDDSDHAAEVVKTEGPFAVGLVAQTRSVALWTGPEMPDTVKRR